MSKVHERLSALRTLIVRHDFVLLVLLSVVHVGLSYMHVRESGALNQSIAFLNGFRGLGCALRQRVEQ